MSRWREKNTWKQYPTDSPLAVTTATLRRSHNSRGRPYLKLPKAKHISDYYSLYCFSLLSNLWTKLVLFLEKSSYPDDPSGCTGAYTSSLTSIWGWSNPDGKIFADIVKYSICEANKRKQKIMNYMKAE